MSVELDFKLQPPFSESEDGQKLVRFAEDLYPILTESALISLFKASEFLLFNDASGGTDTIVRWHSSGLLVLESLRPPRINRKELVLAQLIKVVVASGEQTYRTVFEIIRSDSAGSGLEEKMAKQIDPKFIRRKATISLQNPDEPWLYDLISLTQQRLPNSMWH